MSRLKRLILEIHRRSLWQVLLIYVGGALVAYQAVQALTEGLGLPQWFPGLAVVLFVIGLPFVVATAFVREVAPPALAPLESGSPVHEDDAAVARLEARRRRRSLTWRNAGLSFMAALAVWGVVTTGWLLLADRTEPERMEAAEETRKSLAVLPFENLSPDPENEFFADGIHDEIIAHLSKIADLKVISRTSVMEYKGRSGNLPAIAEELDVTNILEGTVRRADGQVRITTQLIDALNDEHLWTEIYDHNLGDVFVVQSDIAQRVAAAVGAELTPPERSRIEERPTGNLEAYDYYLRGLEYYRRGFTEADERISVEMFERATQSDSSFALAFARLSQAHSNIYWLRYDHSPERLQLARQAADRALELEPDLPEAHQALGYYYYHGHLDYERAMQEFETALSQQPNHADLLEGMGYVERRRGDFQTALSYLERAVELDPRDANKVFGLAQILSQLRYYAEADPLYERVLTLAPQMMVAYAYRALNYWWWEGNTSKVRAVLEEAVDRGLDTVDDPLVSYGLVLVDIGYGYYDAALERLSSGSSEAFSMQGFFVPKAMLAADVYALMNEPELARQHLDSAVALLEAEIQDAPEDSRLYSALGLVYARLGRVDEAIRAGERGIELLPESVDAVEGRSRIENLASILMITGRHDEAIDRLDYLLSVPGTLSVAVLRSGLWAPLHSHPRFQALLEKYEQQ